MHTDITGTWSMDYVNPLFNILLEIKKQLADSQFFLVYVSVDIILIFLIK